MDIDELLKEISADQPAGPDLEYEPEFMELFQIAQGKAEQQVGDTLVAAKEPDWGDIRSRAEAGLARSKNLRVAVLWARAATRIEGITGFDAGIRLVRGIVEKFWETAYPLLDREDGDDPTLRLNALADFNDTATMLRDFRLAVFLKTRDGRIEVRDILTAVGQLPPAGGRVPDPGAIERAILDGTDKAGQSALAAVATIRENVSGLRAFLLDKVGESHTPDWPRFEESLGALAKFCAPLGGDTGEAGAGAAANPTQRTAGGEIRSREDAWRILEQVCEFIERTEPAHPAPLLIRRAQGLLRKNFLEIVEDLSPDSLSSIRRLGGLADN